MAEAVLYWVSLPHATFGVEVVAGVVRDTAPIAAWALGKPWSECAIFWRKKGARVEEVTR